ncbi:MAG: alpha/beta hydrolase [Planctomycetota bacterium]|nr:alpha/beta hydrolase [Planctomycetota bacterium]
MVFFHGGGFRKGDKASIEAPLLKCCLEAGLSVASANYRFSEHAPFPAPMLDGGRAVQFLREHARAWNLDPLRAAGAGASAGADIALWLAYHADLAQPDSTDPIARQSTRLACVAVMGAQSTLDWREVKRVVGGRVHEERVFREFYGLAHDEIDQPHAHRAYAEASALTHVTPAAPPTYLYYGEPDGDLPSDAEPGVGIHHPRFGALLKPRLDALSVPCVLRHRDDFTGETSTWARRRVNLPKPDALYVEMAAFLGKYLKASGA